MLWGHLTSLKYLHHKQHELWGLQEGRCFKIQFPLFSSAGAVRKLAIRRALHGNEMLPFSHVMPEGRCQDSNPLLVSQRGGRSEERITPSSLATVRDQYDNADT